MTFFFVALRNDCGDTGRKLLRLRTSLRVTTPRLYLFACVSVRALVDAQDIPYTHAIGGAGAGGEMPHLLILSEL